MRTYYHPHRSLTRVVMALAGFLVSALLLWLARPPLTVQAVQSINATTDISQRAIWWNRAWHYRLPITISADVTLADKLVTFTVDWPAVFARLQLTDKTLDPNSLRIIEYTPGGHVRNQPDAVNRFSSLPLQASGADHDTITFLAAGQTPAGQTRQFFLYFDTSDQSKAAKDYHYFSLATTESGISGTRSGPDTENVSPANLGMTGFTVPGGDLNFTPFGVNTTDNYVDYPFYTPYGTATKHGIATASYSARLTPVSLQLDAQLSGYDGGSGPEATGSGALTISHLFDASGKPYAVTQGTLTFVVNQQVKLNALNPELVYLRTNGIQQAWASDETNTVQPESLNTTAAFGSGPDALMMANGVNATYAFQLHQLTADSAGFPYTQLLTKADAYKLHLLWSTANGTLEPGDRFSYRFTYLYTPQQLDYDQLKPILDSLNASVTVTQGQPASYSDDLLKAQLAYYEDRAWDFIQSDVLSHGWGKPWNITYGFDPQTDSYSFAHDNDSSMGAGFMLWATSLKAVQTGDQRSYTIADAYANYFLQLEAEDVAEHGASASGRISYGYNGGAPASELTLYTPAGQVTDSSSVDQLTTAAQGLWAYAHLDPGKIRYGSAVRALLGRMAGYLARGGPNVVPNPGLLNLKPLLGQDGGWQTRQSDFPMPGTFYARWLAGQTTDLNTGAVANGFFISAIQDRILPEKDPTKLAHRYQSVLNDGGTATAGYYPLVRGTSYPASWGYFDPEFPTVGMLKSVRNGLVATGGSPASYQLLVGGTRDEISGRMAEHSAVAGWGALEDPDCRLQVAGASGPRCTDWLLDSLHTTVALIQDDRGAITDGSVGTLGVYSGNRHTTEMIDLTGYFLLAMAEEHLLEGTVQTITPRNRFDSVQGIAEADGTTTVRYLGDGALRQTVAVPWTDRPIYATGVFASPTLTFDPSGQARELANRTFDFALDLPDRVLAGGTLSQPPLNVVPTSGTVSVTMTDQRGSALSWTMESETDPAVRLTIGNLPANTPVRLTRDGRPWATVTSDGAGQAVFTYTGGFSRHTFAVDPVTASATTGSSWSTVATPGCAETSPGDPAPWLYAAVPRGDHAIELYFTAAHTPFDHYSLRYGTARGQDTFGLDRFGGLDTRTELVSDLAPATTYYFSVRGGNGCATGPWSNAIAATTERSGAGGLRLQITHEQAVHDGSPASSSETSSPRGTTPSATGGYTVSVTVVDAQGAPVVGARVALHSKVQTTITDQRGVARFTHVAEGQHELVVTYQGESGRQSLYLSGDQVKEFRYTLTIQPTAPRVSLPVFVLVGGLVVVILGGVGALLRLGTRHRFTLPYWRARG